MPTEPSPPDGLRQSRLAAGVALICLLALAETVVAHHARPHPLSAWIWAVLGSAGGAALIACVVFRRRWKRALQAQALMAARPADAPAGTAPP